MGKNKSKNVKLEKTKAPSSLQGIVGFIIVGTGWVVK